MSRKEKTILIVDDEMFIAMDIESKIKNFGYNTIIENTGEKAIQTALNNDNIDLILMDINLGKGIDGTEASKEILKHKDIPIVFHTAYSDKQTIEKVHNITRYGFISKGLSAYILESSLEMAFMLYNAQSKLQDKTTQLNELLLKQTAILYAIPDIIMEVDKNKIYTWANSAGLDFFGNDVVGKEAAYYFAGEQETYNIVSPIFGGDENTVYLESRQYRKDGEIRLLAWWCRVLKNEKNEVIGAISTARDITDQKESEETIQRQNEELRVINEEMEQSYEEMESSNEEIRATNEELLNVNNELEKSNQRIIKVLESIDALVYVIDLDTYEVLFTNKQGKKLWGDIIGKKCWKTISNEKTGPCSYCKKNKLLDKNKNPNGIYSWEYKNTKNGRWYNCKDSAIEWIDGKIVKIQIAFDITENKEKEELIYKNEKKLRSYIDNSPYGVFVTDEKGNYLEINSSASYITGYSVDELIGKNLKDLVYSEDISLALQHFDKVISTGKSSGEIRYIHKTGHIRYWHVNAAKLSDKLYIGFVSDITEFKKNQILLKESEERFKLLHNASFGGIAIHDKGIILECNQGLSDMTGYTIDELIGMDGLLLIAEKSRKYVMKKILSGYEQPYEAYGLRKNGVEFPIHLEARNIKYKGKNVRTVEFRDITRHKEMEANISKRIAYEKLLANISARGVEADTLKNFLNYAINNLGIVTDVSRTYLFEFDEINNIVNNTYEWCAEGIPPQINELQNIPASEVKWSQNNLSKGKILCYNNIEDIPDENVKKLLRPQGIFSILIVPLFVKKKYYGFIGFDECKKNILWVDEDIDLLISISHIISSIIEKKINEQKIILQNQELKESNAEKEILLKEIHHRVKNNLQTVQSLLNMQKNYTDNESVKNILDESINRIRSMSDIHQSLYQTENLSKIDMSIYFNQLIAHLHLSYANENCVVRFYNDINKVYLDIEKAVPLGLLMNEIITNSLKHAFKGRTEGKIIISFQKKADKYILSVKDDGIGLPDNVKILNEVNQFNKTFGMCLISIFSSQLEAELEIIRNNGTEYVLKFSS